MTSFNSLRTALVGLLDSTLEAVPLLVDDAVKALTETVTEATNDVRGFAKDLKDEPEDPWAGPWLDDDLPF